MSRLALPRWLKEQAAALGDRGTGGSRPCRPTGDARWTTLSCWAPTPTWSRPSAHTWPILAWWPSSPTQPLPRKVAVDVGRVHYNRWVYVGGCKPDIARPTATCRCGLRSNRAGGPGSWAPAGPWAGCTSSGPSKPTMVRGPSSAPTSAICGWMTCAPALLPKRRPRASTGSASTP